MSTPPSIDTVHVVFKTHLDIGFTTYAADVIDRYIDDYIPGAIALAESLQDGEDGAGFVWTTGSWLIQRALDHGTPQGVVADVVEHPSQAAAGHRRLAGVDERHLPRLGLALMHFDGVASEIERHVAGVQVVVREEFLDYVALVTQADHEFVDPMRGIQLHDVPQDRPPADLDHRLRYVARQLAEPSAEPTAQHRDYDVIPSVSEGPGREAAR